MADAKRAPEAPLDPTAVEFLARHPRDAANVRLTRAQGALAAALVALAVYLPVRNYFYEWHLYWSHVVQVFCLLYIVILVHKGASILLSLAKGSGTAVPPEEIAALRDEDLPVYTILVPLYREKEVAERILKHLDRLDYPKDKLDVKLLLEADDPETQAACDAAALPPYVDRIVIPHALPKTKPKACNVGLKRARGELLVIYDAEDRPEPDQLKKAVCAFRKADPKTICFQAKLNYFNPDQNLLTKWFTVEYTMWFDLYLPGLHRMGAPIPLGGTSNHFRTAPLREIGGWDPFNVAEDCDLGIRLARMGWRTEMLDSTTWEEATSRLRIWIRQRSRWVKGYIQTHLVHTRRPLRMVRELGLGGTLSFLVTVGGLSLTLLLNPFFWIIGVVKLANPQPMWFENSLLSKVFWWFTVTLAFGNVAFVGMNVLACTRRGYRRYLFHALISPIYWVLISIGAWKGFLQFITHPFYWEKTRHGFAKPPETGP